MCAEFVYPQRFVGKEKPRTLRMVGLRVNVGTEQRKRLDTEGFIFSYPAGSRERAFAISCLAETRRGTPADPTSKDYFGMVCRRLARGSEASKDALNLVYYLPDFVRGDALRLVMECGVLSGSECTRRMLLAGLVNDGKENVPGWKEEQVLEVVRKHVREAISCGRIGRAGVSGTMYPFEEWLRKDAELSDVNLLYYGSECVGVLLEAAGRARNFYMISRMVKELLPVVAYKARRYQPHERIDVLGAFALDMDRNPDGIENGILRIDISCC